MTAISLALLLWRDRNYFSFLWIWSGLWLFQLPSMVQGCYGSSRPRLWEDCSFHSGLLELPGRKTNCSAGETTWKGPGLHGEGEGSSWAQSFKRFYRNTRHVSEAFPDPPDWDQPPAKQQSVTPVCSTRGRRITQLNPAQIPDLQNCSFKSLDFWIVDLCSNK